MRYDKGLPRKRRMKEGFVRVPQELPNFWGKGWIDYAIDINNKKTELKEVMIYGRSPYGLSPKRTPWTIFTATLWLWWWNIRLWLAERGLFVKKVYYDEPNL